MKKKVLILAAMAALAVGVFTTTTQHNSLAVNKAQAGSEVVACYWCVHAFCVIDGEVFLNYYPITVDSSLSIKSKN